MVLSHTATAAVQPFATRLATPEAMADAAVASVPGYALRTCQVGLSVGSCYDPYQMRRAYGLDGLIAAGYDGTGHTIVIVDAYQNPALLQQQTTYDTYYGLPPLVPGVNFVQIAPDGLTPFVVGDGNMTGWAEEISLDVAWAHAMAPGAKIVLVLAKSNQDPDILSALKYAVDHDLGDVISMSFGEAESCLGDLIAGYHDVFAAATLKGITLLASSGDQGAAQPTCDGNSWIKSASHPASDPLVTAVGGTELHAAGWETAYAANHSCTTSSCVSTPTPGTYQGEIAWNEGPPFGDFQANFGSTEATGGGLSVIFDQPPYQAATLPGLHQRAVPDVAYNAAILHGVLTRLEIPGVPPGFYRFGGTSAGAPQWAAIVAIANQKAGHRLGFLNSALYQIGNVGKLYASSLHDVTFGTNSAAEFDSNGNLITIQGFYAQVGWDATTGLGSPIGPTLVGNLIRFTSPGDAIAAVATSKPKPNPAPLFPGKKHPH